MNQPKPKTYWQGPAPVNCDVCGHPLGNTFIDGATRMGPHGCMCPACHGHFGVGLGTGRGQLFERLTTGRWMKTGG